MNDIDQILYRAPRGSGDTILRSASSVADPEADRAWQQLLQPWLRAGGPLGRCYVNFGSTAAAIRWHASSDRRYDWQYASVLVGEPAVLTGDYLLDLPELSEPVMPPGGRLRPVTGMPRQSPRDVTAWSARSAEARELLVPLLGRILEGQQNVIMPWPGPGIPEAAMWGVLDILSMLGDTEPVSFLCYAAGRPPAVAGRLVCFRPGATRVPPDEGYEKMARGLATSHGADRDKLRQVLRGNGLLEAADRASRMTILLRQWPHIAAGKYPSAAAASASRRLTTVTPRPSGGGAPPSAMPATGASPPAVQCPLCLGDVHDWNKLDYWRWNPEASSYEQIKITPGLSEAQRRRLMIGVQVRCPHSPDSAPHYLPLNYGRYGKPVHLGFVGVSKSGKTHLLSAMIHAIEQGELERYGIACSPLDHRTHQRYLTDWVNPLFDEDRVLPDTPEDLTTFVDAFLMSHDGGPQRPVVLFDVAGGLLSGLDDKAPDKAPEFLSIASGLFFIVAPEHVVGRRSSDKAFSNVLDTLRSSDRTGEMSVGIILNKADMLRFEPRVARWLRAETNPLDPVELLRESADVYGYLQRRRAALTTPYKACARGTLHVASPTGGADDGMGGVYPRGVTPHRVVNPLVAMLAMTGVLSGAEAESVGI